MQDVRPGRGRGDAARLAPVARPGEGAVVVLEGGYLGDEVGLAAPNVDADEAELQEVMRPSGRGDVFRGLA